MVGTPIIFINLRAGSIDLLFLKAHYEFRGVTPAFMAILDLQHLFPPQNAGDYNTLPHWTIQKTLKQFTLRVGPGRHPVNPP